VSRTVLIFFFLLFSLLLSPLRNTGHPRNALLHFSFLILRQLVELHGREISPSQGRYLHTGQHIHKINADKHPCPRSQCSRKRRRSSRYRLKYFKDRCYWFFPELLASSCLKSYRYFCTQAYLCNFLYSRTPYKYTDLCNFVYRNITEGFIIWEVCLKICMNVKLLSAITYKNAIYDQSLLIFA
jgi:hypothetical protein